MNNLIKVQREHDHSFESAGEHLNETKYSYQFEHMKVLDTEVRRQ